MTADNSVNIDINAKVNADFDPLIKATPKGIGRVISLLFANREAKNLRDTLLMAAKTQVEYEMILSGKYTYENGKLVLAQYSTSTKELDPIDVEKRQGLNNLSGNIRIAIEALKDIPDEEIPEEEVSDDFFARWRREAKVTSDEHLQKLWGRLLAEEIVVPRSISFRALDILKNITADEAKLFQKIAPYVCDNEYFVCDPERDRLPDGIVFDDLLTLVESGLTINADSNLIGNTQQYVIKNNTEHAYTTCNGLIFVSTGREKSFHVPGIKLTSTGKLCLKICDFDRLDLNKIQYMHRVIVTGRGGNTHNFLVYKKHNNTNYDDDEVLFDTSVLSKNVIRSIDSN